MPSKLKLKAVWSVCPSIFDAAVPVGATLITHGESVLSPKIKNVELIVSIVNLLQNFIVKFYCKNFIVKSIFSYCKIFIVKFYCKVLL